MERTSGKYNDLYNKGFDRYENEEASHLHNLFSMIQGSHVLNAGCFHQADLDVAAEGKWVTVVDDHPERVKAATKLLVLKKEELLSKLTLIQADFLRYDFKGTQFDTVIIANVLEYSLFPEQWIKKAFSVLNEGGVLLAAVPFGWQPSAGIKKTYFLLDFLELAEKEGPIEDYGIWDGNYAYLKAVKKENYKGMLLDLRDVLGKCEKAFLLREKTGFQKNEVLDELRLLRFQLLQS